MFKFILHFNIKRNKNNLVSIKDVIDSLFWFFAKGHATRFDALNLMHYCYLHFSTFSNIYTFIVMRTWREMMIKFGVKKFCVWQHETWVRNARIHKTYVKHEYELWDGSFSSTRFITCQVDMLDWPYHINT